MRPFWRLTRKKMAQRPGKVGLDPKNMSKGQRINLVGNRLEITDDEAEYINDSGTNRSEAFLDQFQPVICGKVEFEEGLKLLQPFLDDVRWERKWRAA